MSKQTQTFLACFAKLEKLAAKEARKREENGFLANVSLAKERNPIVRRNANDIEMLAKLRNVLVHVRDSRFDPRYLAEPLPELVTLLENIIQQIEKPARVVQHFKAQIDEFAPDDTMVEVLRFLAMKDFSQTFVRIGDALHILTAGTIQRWLGHNATDELIDCTVSVGTVLDHKEELCELIFADRRTTLAEALVTFDSEKNPRLAALVITETGRATETPMALLTPTDLGAVTRILEGR